MTYYKATVITNYPKTNKVYFAMETADAVKATEFLCLEFDWEVLSVKKVAPVVYASALLLYPVTDHVDAMDRKVSLILR